VLATEGHEVNRKRVSRLMALMGIRSRGIRNRNWSQPGEGHPDLSVLAERNQGASASIRCGARTSPISGWRKASFTWWRSWTGSVGFVLSWSLSLTMGGGFLHRSAEAVLYGGAGRTSSIVIQGSQFTSEKFTGELEAKEIAISMDGRGRCMDNIFVERLWRSLKYGVLGEICG